MIGDDLWTDVLAAQRLGMRGIFVLSGKHGMAELRQAADQPRGGGRPDLVADSLAAAIDALD
jgi:ribonucleotide monophosphatase NagD (HAD superfamily)